MKANLIISIVAVQMTVGCAASLTEQCRQLKTAKELLPESYYKSEKETDEVVKQALLIQSMYDTAKSVESVQLSDNNLKSVQKRIVKNQNDYAKFFTESLNYTLQRYSKESKTIIEESKNINNDLKAICSS